MAAKTSLGIYNAARQSIASKFTDPRQRALALQRFDADPRVQQVRKLAGLAPVSSPQVDVKAIARKALQEGQTSTGEGVRSGFDQGTFGIPQMLAAAGLRFLPSALTGNKTNLSYSDILNLARTADKTAADQHPIANLAGNVAGTVATGAVAAPAIEAAAASKLPALAKVGNYLQNLTTLKKGALAANVGKLAVMGGAQGGAEAASQGGDIATGAATGAIAAPALAGVGHFVLRPAADILGLTNAGAYLRRFTSTPVDTIKASLAALQAKGVNPTLFEVLPLADRNRLMEHVITGHDPAVEQTLTNIQKRAANVGPEMTDTVRAATAAPRAAIHDQMVTDLQTARGSSSGTPVAGAPGEDETIAHAAMSSPTAMQDMYHKEASLIMAPHDATPVVDKFSDLLPQVPATDENGVTRSIETDPELSSMIRTAGGRLAARKPGEPITVAEVSNMISRLRKVGFQGGNDGALAENAAEHLEGVIGQNAPDAGTAVGMMRDAYASRKRMAEGMREGWFTRLSDAQQPGTNDAAGNTLKNAYTSPEGQTGLFLGQTNRLTHDLGASPTTALNTAGDIASGDTSREVAQNLGSVPADQIGDAAGAQAQGIKTLSAAGNQAKSNIDPSIGPRLAQGITALTVHSFPMAKFHAWKQIAQATAISDAKAKTVADMLFSTDKGLQQKALDYLGNQPDGSGLMNGLLGLVQRGGAAIADALPGTAAKMTADALAVPAEAPPADDSSLPDLPDVADAPAAPDASSAPTDANDPYAGIAAPADTSGEDPYASIGTSADPSKDSPYSGKLAAVLANENPDMVNLLNRQWTQESHFDPKAVSKKGAVGVGQVMPKTLPEAAAAAGVPVDEKAYHSDPAYQKLISHGYMSTLLTKYGGDPAKALAAYNAGPGRVDKALAAPVNNWMAVLPPETQDYVAKVGG